MTDPATVNLMHDALSKWFDALASKCLFGLPQETATDKPLMTDPTPNPPSWNDLLDALRRCVHQLEHLPPRYTLSGKPSAEQHGRALLERVDAEMRAGSGQRTITRKFHVPPGFVSPPADARADSVSIHIPGYHPENP